MNAAIARAIARFDALSVRERLLVLVACVAVVVFLVHSRLIAPVIQESARTRAQVSEQQRALESLRQATHALEQDTRDPDAANRALRDQLLRETAAFDRQIEAAALGLVPAERMAALLEGLVARDRRLTIDAVRSLPPAPLVQAAAGSKPDTATSSEPAGIFRHGIEITVAGSYPELTEYVASLERLPTRMYFGRALLDARAYPRVTLTLTLYTISLERAWLRV